MNYILFKADGSINEKNLAYYIQQGNTGVDTIFVSKADIEDEGSYTCQAFFRLPNGTTNTLAGVWSASVEYKTGVFANGWMITLTTNQTTYNGLLQMSVSLLLSSSNLLTYPVALVINETGYRPDEDSGVTIEEINSYLVQLQSYQLKYDLANVRGYNTLELATADLPNLADGQIVVIRDGGSSVYQVQSGALVDLTVNKATSDSLGNVIKDSYVSAVYPTYNSTTDKLFIETHSVEDVLMANNEVILPKATTTKNGLMAKEDKVKIDNLPTTYETIVNSDSKIKELGGYHTTIGSMLTALNGKLTGMYITTLNSTPIEKVLILYYNGSSNSGGATVIYGGGAKYYLRDTNSVWTLSSTNATQEWANTQLATKQSTSQKGQPNGYASLDSGGKVPSTQLPSYVDDVLEFANLAGFPATGSASVIYVALDTNLTYRWSGSAYVEISPSLALGETSSTAYRGDRGKTAYDHSQVVSGNPHNVTKGDIGLDNVDNTSDEDKPISTATQAELDDKAPIVSPSFLGTTTITRTEADATTALSVEKSNGSATGNIAEFKLAGVKVGQLDKTGMFSGGVEQIVANKNKYLPLLGRSSDGAVIARFGTTTWNGSAWVADNGSYGFGFYSLYNNTGAESNGFGFYSLYNNTGAYSNGFGNTSLQNNTGAYSNGFGYASLYNNTGTNSSGFGHNSLTNNTGANSNGFGHNSLQNNTGTNSSGFGYASLRYNQKANNTAVGYNAYGDVFLTNVAGAKTFDYTAIDITLERATIVAHGFGATNEMVNVKYTATTGTAIGGIALDATFQIKIIDADTIEFINRNITSQGTGTHTFTPQFAYTNTTSLGANTVPNKDNQVVLGNTAVDTIKMGGTFRTPASSTATGVKGEWCYDANYIYVCTATNEWKRTAITTW